MEKSLDIAPGAERTIGSVRRTNQMKLKELCQRTGLSQKTIRLYEDI